MQDLQDDMAPSSMPILLQGNKPPEHMFDREGDDMSETEEELQLAVAQLSLSHKRFQELNARQVQRRNRNWKASSTRLIAKSTSQTKTYMRTF